METVILRLIQEKDLIEEKLIQEVNHKQRIVLTLEQQKNNITQEIQAKIEEIKRHRRDIQVKLGYKAVDLQLGELKVAPVSPSIEETSTMVDTSNILKRDLAYFDKEKSRMMTKIIQLTT